MNGHIHHIAGRLRLKLPQLKHQPARARTVAAAIRQVDGVSFVEASSLSGSLLIRYPAVGAERDALLVALERALRGLGLSGEPSQCHYSKAAPAALAAGLLTEKLLEVAVQKCLERCGFALLGILL
ncbi:MAG: hypothetical protein H7Z39_03585 [Burkholderiaceae bacterium]|nr:hypothetical protein [Burkholderiaceae bacterium]